MVESFLSRKLSFNDLINFFMSLVTYFPQLSLVSVVGFSVQNMILLLAMLKKFEKICSFQKQFLGYSRILDKLIYYCAINIKQIHIYDYPLYEKPFIGI